MLILTSSLPLETQLSGHSLDLPESHPGEVAFSNFKREILEQLSSSPLCTLRLYYESGPNETLLFTIFAGFERNRKAQISATFTTTFLSSLTFGKLGSILKGYSVGWIAVNPMYLFLLTSRQGVEDLFRAWVLQTQVYQPSAYRLCQRSVQRDIGDWTTRLG